MIHYFYFIGLAHSFLFRLTLILFIFFMSVYEWNPSQSSVRCNAIKVRFDTEEVWLTTFGEKDEARKEWARN